MEEGPPIFIPKDLERLLEKQIVRPLKEPEVYHDVFLPPKRHLLICGQKGTQLFQMVTQILVKKHNLKYDALVLKPIDTTFPKKFSSNVCDVLIIENAHLLQNVPHLWDLEDTCAKFVICLSKVPYNEDHPFFKQFEDNKIVVQLPDAKFYKELLMFYFKGWQNYYKGKSKMLLSDDDFDWLSRIACAYCTSKDVRRFCYKVCGKAVEMEPESSLDITLDLLQNVNNLFLFQPFNQNQDIYCLVNENKEKYQTHFEMKIQNIPLEPVVKRQKTSVSHDFVATGEVVLNNLN